jgi:hypothetical protein
MSYQNEYLKLLDLVYHVAQSLEGKVHPDPRMHDCNQLACKLFSHGATIYWLRQGTKAPVAKPDGIWFYDFPSVQVIARAALETYLTMFEVFFEKITDDEREYRYAIWKLSGLVIREIGCVRGRAPNTGAIAASQQEIDTLRARIQKTVYFAGLTQGQQRAALRGKRSPGRFADRLRRAGFAPGVVRAVHQYLSGFVHSDGLASMQGIQANTKAKQTRFIESSMGLVMMVMARMIRKYREVFPSAEAWCLAKPEAAYLAEVYAGAGALLDQIT